MFSVRFCPSPIWERQDYYFRYDSGIQLQLLGDSLMGWFVADIMRAVDLLVGRRDIDPNRLIVMGAVAGGGDPAAVAAGLADAPNMMSRDAQPAIPIATFFIAASFTWSVCGTMKGASVQARRPSARRIPGR